MTAARPLLALAAAWVACLGCAEAQTTITRSETAASGKAVRLVLAPNLKKDCSTGPMPEIRVATPPKNGSIITKSGKLKTPASFRCPNKEAEIQAVFYQSKPGFTGADEVLVEIKTADGSVERQDLRITVEAAKKDDKKEEKKDSKDATDL